MDNFNKNEKQHNFNQIKGELIEVIEKEKYGYVVLNVGHENKRLICLNIKKQHFKDVVKDKKIGDKVTVKFYLRSVKGEKNWFTTANVLEICIN